jgi:carboxymethylenebutenolidase
MAFKKPLRDEAEAVFAARKDKPEYVEYEFKDYKGTVPAISHDVAGV